MQKEMQTCLRGKFLGSARSHIRFGTIELLRASFCHALPQLFSPLVDKCKRLGRAMRIGTNHGSLSARILSYYGDTPRGMVESAFEFADICRNADYHNFLFSMKASNPLVMVQVCGRACAAAASIAINRFLLLASALSLVSSPIERKINKLWCSFALVHFSNVLLMRPCMALGMWIALVMRCMRAGIPAAGGGDVRQGLGLPAAPGRH